MAVRRVAAALLALVLSALPLASQSAVVTRNVNLRTGPSTAQAIIRLLRPPDEIVILDPHRQNGYYEVRTAGGTHGWVWSRNVHIPQPPPALVDSQPAAMGPPEIYRGCPLEGSAVAERYRASNRLKNRLTAPAATDVDSSATLLALLTRGAETDWSTARGASLVGYVFDVKEGGEETVNCGDTDVRYRDTHIEVVLDSTNTRETVRLIVEVTPRWRAYMKTTGVDWSTPALQHALTGRWVRFTGWLFWDFSHADEAELTDPGGAHNWRATAWEIHPVTGIRVCQGPPQTCH
jgi:Bacterial SH3 domain